MSTRAKIKISDDIELRKILDDEYEKSSQVKLCKYALSLEMCIRDSFIIQRVFAAAVGESGIDIIKVQVGTFF